MYWKTGFKSNFKKHFETTREFLFFLSRRAQNDTIFRVAASLSYTSLIAVVPLFAIGLAIFSAFPVFDGVKEQVKEFLLRNFVPTIEQEVSQYFAEFIDAAAQLTTIGVVGIAITAILMLSTIENSLNFIFKVTRPRRLTTKITLYWTVITLGPLLLGTAFSLRGYLFTLQKFMPEDLANTQLLLSKLLPSLITMFLLVLVYVLVPNKRSKSAAPSSAPLSPSSCSPSCVGDSVILWSRQPPTKPSTAPSQLCPFFSSGCIWPGRWSFSVPLLPPLWKNTASLTIARSRKSSSPANPKSANRRQQKPAGKIFCHSLKKVLAKRTKVVHCIFQGITMTLKLSFRKIREIVGIRNKKHYRKRELYGKR